MTCFFFLLFTTNGCYVPHHAPAHWQCAYCFIDSAPIPSSLTCQFGNAAQYYTTAPFINIFQFINAHALFTLNAQLLPVRGLEHEIVGHRSMAMV